jgi:hypothetical protein
MFLNPYFKNATYGLNDFNDDLMTPNFAIPVIPTDFTTEIEYCNRGKIIRDQTLETQNRGGIERVNPNR